MTQKRRTLPPVSPKMPTEMRPLISAMSEVIETGEGVRGNPLDKKVTLRDLLDSGIGKLKNGARAGMPGSLESGVEPPAPSLSRPPVPEGFSAEGSFYGMITLTWDSPVELYDNHAHTNIYRSEADNFANAQVAGRDPGMIYSDVVRDDTTDAEDPKAVKGYYYWITFTSTAGVEGPPNSSSGTYAEPVADISYVMDIISGRVNEDVLTPAFKNRLDGFSETISKLGDRYTLSINQNGDVAGYTLFNDGSFSSFSVLADNFTVANSRGNRVNPFIVEDNISYLDTAMIREGSIQEGKVGPITVGKLFKPDGTPVTTAAGLFRADAIEADKLRIGFGQVTGDLKSTARGNNGRPAWRLDRDGEFELNSTGAGGRMEQRGDRISVYDESGRLRIRIGRL
ncbi:hypothetical protein [Chromohalobacter sp. 296-RDG]|uniref:phage tail tip fiber protein n=1 Tax=Chromohalobacter sp. 296-RDG TaxID=2994062 RepID=UPI002468CA4E|nr:hypothetical protein [Chromohalobacter sp. 296-RDG]